MAVEHVERIPPEGGDSPSGGIISPPSLAILDWTERLGVLSLYGWLVYRLVQGSLAESSIINLFLLPSEGLVVFFLLIRRPAGVLSVRWTDWLLAIGATVLPMLVSPVADRGLLPPSWAALLFLFGLVVQLLAKCSLGRSMGCVPAARGLVIRGPYRFLRHPMYAGYLLSHLAFVLMNPSAWNVVLYLLCYLFQVPRLLAEERLLSCDPGYRHYQLAVRYRLVPGVF